MRGTADFLTGLPKKQAHFSNTNYNLTLIVLIENIRGRLIPPDSVPLTLPLALYCIAREDELPRVNPDSATD